MANLFWGNSDALDLYGEYIDAKKQIVSKYEELTKKINVERETNATGASSTEQIEADKDRNNEEKDKKASEKAAKERLFAGGRTYRIVHGRRTLPADEEKGSLTSMCSDMSISNDADVRSKSSEENRTSIKSFGDKETTLVNTSKDVGEDIANFKASDDVQEFKITINDKEVSKEYAKSGNSFETEKEDHSKIMVEDKNPSEIKKLEEHTSVALKETISDGNNNIGKNCDVDGPEQKIVIESSHFEEPNKIEQKTGIDQSGDFEKKKETFSENEDAGNAVGGEKEGPKQCVLNILILGGGDPRHIIKTMAKRYTHCSKEGNASTAPILKFFVAEGCMEVIARNIALLSIALESPELISLRNKVHLFMDVYGNTLLRPICHQYLVSKAGTLLKMISDKSIMQKIAPFIHIDGLKYREIDTLQDTFQFWQPKPGYDFNIKDSWTSRLRRLLAVRYDARDGVFDWDLNMSLKDRGCEQICSQEYRYWRETGIAFTYPEYEQCKPNKTLAAGLVRNGGRYLNRGYIGDIQTGPFCTFGLRTAEERMHHSAHGENDYRATDITERNLFEYFHEIQNGTAYVHNSGVSHKYGGVRFQMGERLIYNESENLKAFCSYDQPWINVEGIETHFIPLQEVKDIGKGSPKWEEFFDVAFVGHKFFDFVTDSFPNVLRENSLLIFETKLRSVEVKGRLAEFENELHSYARHSRLMSLLNYKALNSKNSILKFWKPDKIVQAKMEIE